jgi:hypothetical protein
VLLRIVEGSHGRQGFHGFARGESLVVGYIRIVGAIRAVKVGMVVTWHGPHKRQRGVALYARECMHVCECMRLYMCLRVNVCVCGCV